MTPQELVRTKTFRGLGTDEQQNMLRQVKSGELNLAAAPSPTPDEIYYPGIATGPPRQTGTPFEALMGPAKWGAESPTFAEQYLPESLPTRALSGLERGVRMTLGGAGTLIGGPLGLLERASEQAPRLLGEEPYSSPISRVTPEIPGLVLQGMMPSTGTGVTRLPPATRLGADAERRILEASRAGVPLTGPESSRFPWIMRQIEALTEPLFGGGRIGRYKAGVQAEDTAAAARRVGEMLNPDEVSPAAGGMAPHELSVAKVTAAQEAEAARQAARAEQAGTSFLAPAEEFVQGLGPVQESASYLDAITRRLSGANRTARRIGNQLYQAVERLAGTDPVIALSDTADASTQAVEDAAKLRGLATQPSTRTAGALRDAAVEAVDELGLTQGRNVDLKTARALDSELGSRARAAYKAGNDKAGRQIDLLQEAVRRDINRFAADAPGDLGQKLRAANEFWRTRVAEPFNKGGFLRDLKDAKAVSSLDQVLFHKTGAERIAQIKQELDRVDPEAWSMVRSRFGQKLLREGFDPETGHFDPVKFTRALHEYSQESLNAILGDKAAGMNRLRDRFQRAAAGAEAIDNPIQAAAVFREFAKRNPETIVWDLAKRPASEVEQIKAALSPGDWSKLTRAWWDDVMLHKTTDPTTGIFSRARFLTNLDRVRDPATLKLILGDEAGPNVENLVKVLREQERLSKVASNVSGSGKLVALGTQASALVGAIYVGSTTRVLGTGAIVLGPNVVARMLTHPRGSGLLLDAARVYPGTRAADAAVRRIAIFLARQETPEPENGGRP